MLKSRLIPVLLLQNGLLVRSEQFKTHQVIGNPIHEVERFNEWNVDELIYLDISQEGSYDLRRNDQKVKNLEDPLFILEEVSKTCFMPLTWGGKIRTIDDMQIRFQKGADKITINTLAYQSPDRITEAAKKFGSQAIVVCIDVLRDKKNQLEVFVEGGKVPTKKTPKEWASEIEKRGAGEILLQSIDRDGTARGYDLDLIYEVASTVSIPVIALGGVGQYEDYAKGIEAGASAVAAANIFHFKELTDRNSKRALQKSGVEVRI